MTCFFHFHTRFSRFIGRIRMYQYPIPFRGCITFHCVHMPRYVCWFIRWRAGGLLHLLPVVNSTPTDVTARASECRFAITHLLHSLFFFFISLFSHRCPRVNAGEINNYLLGFKHSLSPKLSELVKDPPQDQAGQDI